MTRQHGDRGSMAIEMVAYVPALLVAALFVAQLLIAAVCATQTSAAVRDAARAYSEGDDPAAAARHSLAGWLRPGLQPVTEADGTVSVNVRIPILVPGFTVDEFTVHRVATMPDTR